MPKYSEKRSVPYTAQQMFDLVVDVAAYADFLPWVVSASVYNKRIDGFEADLVVGGKGFTQSYTSDVTFHGENKMITSNNINGPFKHLSNRWRFLDLEAGTKQSSEIEFFLDFEIDNIILRPVLQPFLHKATEIMIDAFQKRAAELYD